MSSPYARLFEVDILRPAKYSALGNHIKPLLTLKRIEL
jgi:hypothetical protein